MGQCSLARLLAALFLAAALPLACSGHGDKDPDVERLVAPDQEASLRPAVSSMPHDAVTDLYVFGDSLSDTGLLRERTFGFYLVKDTYWRGRACNGPNWVDYASNALGAFPHNYAVAGAATDATPWPVGWVLPSLADEVDTFLADLPAEADGPSLAGAVAVIWIGPNNYLGSSKPASVAQRDITAAAERLLTHRIKHLFIGTMPDLAGTLKAPDQRRKSDTALHQLTAAHNAALATVVVGLKQRFPASDIAVFHAYETNEASIAKPLDYGFTSLTKACYQGDYNGHFHAASGKQFCADYLGVKMWDYLHPNTRMQCHYAAAFLADLHAGGLLPGFDGAKAHALCTELAPVGAGDGKP